MDDALYIAVDLGAGSGRVFIAGLARGEWLVEEVRRFHYPPRHAQGHLRWPAAQLFDEVRTGLAAAGARARELRRPVRSVGVDGWGVDYGLIDAAGRLLDDPVCYRDDRTRGAMEGVFARLSRAEIFARTGVQFLPINTLFQLAAHVDEGLPAGASRLLLVPDLVNHVLTGERITEFTNATTTQLVNAASGRWDPVITAQLGLPHDLLGPIVPAGEPLGPLLPAIGAAAGLPGVTVVAPATHDTASAVAGAPLRDGWAYISSGTWSLVGVERLRAQIDDEVARHNFSNEGGVFGTVRFLKNVTGLWVLECCRREWQAQGLDADYEPVLRGVRAVDGCCGVVFPDDPRLLNPPSMLAALAEQMAETGQMVPSNVAEWAKVILDSLALRYASVLQTVESLTGRAVEGVQIVGGGSRNAYLNQATATATGRPVLAGPTEATVTGNVLVQALAAGRFASLAEARQYVGQHMRPSAVLPRATAAWDDARRRYEALERQYTMPGATA